MRKKFRAFFIILIATLAVCHANAQTFYKPNELGGIVKKAFKENDFESLDKLAQKLRTEKSRTPSGLWNLSVFYANLPDGFLEGRTENTEAQWGEIESRINQWIAAAPQSAFAPIALAIAQQKHAWALRGNGFANTVTEKGWEGFTKYMRAASETLQANKKISSNDPQWYVEMLAVALAQNWKIEQYLALYEEAVAKEPLYYGTYFQAVERFLPMWGGDMQKVQNFATDAVRRTSSTDGQAMYARIYSVTVERIGGRTFFAEPHKSAIWIQIKNGFEDVLKKYPVDHNKNLYAKLACQIGEVDLFISLTRSFNSKPSEDAWPKDYFQKCKDYALKLRPNDPL
jgi:hypothetical protein